MSQVVVADDEGMSEVVPQKERLTCSFMCVLHRKILLSVFVGYFVIISGFVNIVLVYTPDVMYFRLVTFFACIVILYVVLAFIRSFRFLARAFYGQISEQPFARPDEDETGTRRLVYEVFNTNGKYYLTRIFGSELLEMLWQVYMYSNYVCIIPPHYLSVYTLVLCLECGTIMHNLYPLNKRIDSSGKNRMVLVDIMIELFCTIYPLVVVFYGLGIPISESQIMQITFVPLMFLLGKMNTLSKQEVLLALDQQRNDEVDVPCCSWNQGSVTRHDPVHAHVANAIKKPQKRKRRSSLGLRQLHVVNIQNDHFVGRLKLCHLSFFIVLFMLLLYSTVAQLVNIPPSDHVTMRFCRISVPMCNHILLPSDNCVYIHKVDTLQNTVNNQQVLIEAMNHSALQVLKIGGVQEASPFRGTTTRNLKVLRIYNSPNLTTLDVDISSWGLSTLELFNLSNVSYVHPSLFESVTFAIKMQFLNKLHVIAFRNLQIQSFVLNTVSSVDTDGLDAPRLRFLGLNNVNLQRLPRVQYTLRSLTVIMNPELQTLGPLFPKVLLYIDVRHSAIPIEELERYSNLKYRFAHGNAAGCPTGWGCEPFCEKTCLSPLYNNAKLNALCTADCMSYKCANVNPRCIALFDDYK